MSNTTLLHNLCHHKIQKTTFILSTQLFHSTILYWVDFIHSKEKGNMASTTHQQEWLRVAEPIIGTAVVPTMLLSFATFFGVDPFLCHSIWTMIFPTIVSLRMNDVYKKKHLLWGLYFLRVYGTEQLMAATCRTTPKTFRKWARFSVTQIAALKFRVVSYCLIRLIFVWFDWFLIKLNITED